MQVHQQADADRPRFRLTRADVWHGLRGLLRLTHAAALAAVLREIPDLFAHALTAATSAEQRSFVAVACLHEVFATLGAQVTTNSVSQTPDTGHYAHVRPGCTYGMSRTYGETFKSSMRLE